MLEYLHTPSAPIVSPFLHDLPFFCMPCPPAADCSYPGPLWASGSGWREHIHGGLPPVTARGGHTHGPIARMQGGAHPWPHCQHSSLSPRPIVTPVCYFGVCQANFSEFVRLMSTVRASPRTPLHLAPAPCPFTLSLHLAPAPCPCPLHSCASHSCPLSCP